MLIEKHLFSNPRGKVRYRNTLIFKHLRFFLVCPEPPTIPDTEPGTIIETQVQYFPGDSVTYTCAGTALVLDGPAENTCLSASSTWLFSTAPSCVARKLFEKIVKRKSV